MQSLAAETGAVLEGLRRRPHRLAATERFQAVVRDPTPAALLRHAQSSSKPAIGYLCALAPLELIAAAGAVPVRLDSGSAECASAAGEAMHRDCCPMVRATWGLLSLLKAEPELLDAMSMLIAPRPCDWKAALPETLTDEFGIEVAALDVPHTRRRETSRHSWRDQIRDLAADLQRTTGNAITRAALGDAIRRYQRAAGISRTLAAAMAADNPPMWGSDLLLVYAAAPLMTVDEWTEASEALVAEVRERVTEEAGIGADRPRLLLAGSPCVWPHFRLPLLAEESGGVVVADESCAGSRLFYDSVYVDEPTVPDMIDAVADRYLLPCTCPIFAEPEDRLLRLEAIVEDFRPDGVIYHVLKSCFVYDMQLAAVQERLEAMDLPVLRIETDYGQADDEALRTRLEAFTETLAGRRKSSAV
jgi:benzoyl-CoA reductase/2-hydroxyglutaryl-CoA dehydratase subunit BcrC/BadD/HgdB